MSSVIGEIVREGAQQMLAARLCGFGVCASGCAVYDRTHTGDAPSVGVVSFRRCKRVRT